MAKYYLPKEEELEVGLKIEFYAEENWHPHIVEHLKGWWKYLENEDIRVKYLDSLDFNELGYFIEKKHLKQQDVVTGYKEDGTEIMGKEDLYDEHTLLIIKDKVSVGEFMPWIPENNVKLKGKLHTVKNITELRKILK